MYEIYRQFKSHANTTAAPSHPCKGKGTEIIPVQSVFPQKGYWKQAYTLSLILPGLKVIQCFWGVCVGGGGRLPNCRPNSYTAIYFVDCSEKPLSMYNGLWQSCIIGILTWGGGSLSLTFCQKELNYVTKCRIESAMKDSLSDVSLFQKYLNFPVK